MSGNLASLARARWAALRRLDDVSPILASIKMRFGSLPSVETVSSTTPDLEPLSCDAEIPRYLSSSSASSALSDSSREFAMLRFDARRSIQLMGSGQTTALS